MPELPKVDSLGLLYALMPGLLVFMVHRWLCSRARKIEVTEMLLEALVYTLVVNAAWEASAFLTTWLTSWKANATGRLVGLTAYAIVTGVIVAVSVNQGWSYGLLRRFKLTTESAWITPWETCFRTAWRDGFDYALFELDDERRIVGAVLNFPHDSKGHIVLTNVCWIDETNNYVPAKGRVLLPVEKIVYVNFLPSDSLDNEPIAASAPNSASHSTVQSP